MKDFFCQILSVFLALVVLGSTSSFSIGKHYCGEHLVDVAFFGEAEPCAMERAFTEIAGCNEIKMPDCCSDEQVVIEGQDELKINFNSVDFQTVVFLSAYIYSYDTLFQDLEEHFVPFDGYPPPLITQDFHTLYEQYLI